VTVESSTIDPADSLADLGPIVTQDAATAWLDLDGSEPAEWVSNAVDAGNQAFLDWLGWDPRSFQVTETVSGTGGRSLILTRKKITAVTSVCWLLPGNPTPQPLDVTFISADPKVALITAPKPFVRGTNNFQVTYTAGYATLPSAITQGILYTIKAILDASGVDFNATGESFSGVLSQQFNAQGPGVVPPAAQTISQRYKRDVV
jgi:hypothetical protein